MQTAVRKGRLILIFWGDTPTPEFCENSHERGPRSPAGTSQGFDPPLGPHRSAAGTARTVCAGVKRAAAHWRRCASAGAAQAVFAGAARARRSAGRAAGASGARGAGAFLPGAALVKSELFCARILVASVGLLFRRRGVMNVSRRAGRAKSPAGKRNDQAKGAHTP